MSATTTHNYQLESARWSTGRNVLALAALISIVACIAGYIQDPDRFFRSYLVAFTYACAIGLGAFFFVMVQFLSGSAWSVTMRRIMENIMITLPVGALLFVPIAFGLNHIYPWTNPTLINSSQLLRAKSGFLVDKFFIARTYGYFALWSIWIFALCRQSIKADDKRSIQQMRVASRWSAPGLFLVVAVGTLAAYDWLMTVEPSWYSTIFGLYYLADGAVLFFSVMILICLGFRKAGVLDKEINIEHYHDLGKWLFAMTCFYTYIGFSQFLLIWYANLPDETQFYRHRMPGTWLYISLSLPFIRFFIPFFTLISRPAKRNLKIIGFMAVWSLIVVYLDLYWIVMPVFYPNGPQIHWLDFATLGAVVSIAGLVFWSRFRRHAMVPVGDLRLEQSLHFENA
ncbi:MAG: hypothetical protein LAO55_01695 [Acidobacteriia bacterium]|nr:hypothetical protein [Terriglobia bacterium]